MFKRFQPRRHLICAATVAMVCAAAAPARPQDMIAADAAGLGHATLEHAQVLWDLVWTGHFDRLIAESDEQGRVRAIRSFQRQLSAAPTGKLTSGQSKLLASTGEQLRVGARFKLVCDQRAGVTLGIPFAFVSEATANSRGVSFRSTDNSVEITTFRYALEERTLEEFRDNELELGGPSAQTLVDRDHNDWFIVMRLAEPLRRYTRATQVGDEIRGYTVRYHQKVADVFHLMVTAMSNTFRAYVACKEQEPESHPSVPARPAQTALYRARSPG
jgi:hypothetical protein